MKSFLRFGMTGVLIFFLSLLILSCENNFSSIIEDAVQEEPLIQTAAPYLVISVEEADTGRLLTPQASVSARPIVSTIQPSQFSDITFTGTSSEGRTLSVTAADFAQLSANKIFLDAGTWSFTLTAYLGKTETNPGGKYLATASANISTGENSLSMILSPAPVSLTSEAERLGSWQTTLAFPADTIDKIKVYLLTYADFSSGATGSASTLLYQFIKGTDYEAAGNQTILTNESTLQMGSYVIYIEYFTNLNQQTGPDSTTVQEMLLNTWAELLRISPGAKSEGTITLPAADPVYTIQYDLGGPDYSWVASPVEVIPLSYTRNSGGATGIITLPTVVSFVDRGPLYTFEGWYTDENFAAGTGPVTSFSAASTENKHFYAKWHEPVYDVYVKAGANDSIADGTKAKPFSSVTLAAYQAFDDITGTNSDGSYKSTIHILSDYTGTNKITVPWGNGASELNGMKVNLVGEKGEVANTPVELDVCVGSGNSFIYLEHNQKMKISHINITSSAAFTNPNGFASLSATEGTVLYFEDSTIKNYTASGCSAINVEGVVHLKNCEISQNKAIDADAGSGIWGCAVNYGSGTLYLDGNVIIKNNKILKNDGSGDEESETYNLYIGSYDTSGVLHFTPVFINGSLTGSEIWVKLAQEPGTFTSGYGTQTGVPSDYFHCDSGYEVRLFTGEARVADVMYVYIASDGHDNAAANGTTTNPYASLGYAIQKITERNNPQIDATIYVKDDVACNTIIIDGTTGGEQLIANSLSIEGLGAAAALNGNTNGIVLDSRTSVPLLLKDITIKNGRTDYRGGGLHIDGTSVEINNCIIENNGAKIQGGGVYLTNGAQLTMSGESSAIRGNAVTTYLDSTTTVSTNKCGGGVYIDSNSTFTMNAGIIEGNGAFSGGGVYVRGTFEMNGTTTSTQIKSNKRIHGNNNPNVELSSLLGDSVQLTSNVEVGIPGTFNMNGGIITSNLSRGQNGAGVCVFASSSNGDSAGTAKFNMNDGEISGLTISENAAVYLSGSFSGCNLEFNMSGGKISNNTSIGGTSNVGGAAVYAAGYSNITMTGGEISNNHANRGAGGIYLAPISGTGVPVITLGGSASVSTIKIKDNTAGSPAVNGNIYLNDDQTITVAGALSSESEIGITRTYSSSPFTTGYAGTNSGTAPAEIFTSDADYAVIAGTGGEAAFYMASAGGTVYSPGDYHFTLAASRSFVYRGQAASVTITPAITRTEPDGTTRELFYNASDHKLYLDSLFTLPTGGENEVTWSASLWYGADVEVPSLAAGTGSDVNKFTIPALDFENTYTMNVVANYMDYAHDASFTVQCVE